MKNNGVGGNVATISQGVMIESQYHQSNLKGTISPTKEF